MNDFLTVLAQCRKGAAVGELTEKLTEVVEAVRATGKQGELTLKLVIKPVGRGAGDTLILMDHPKAVVPEHDRAETMFYATDDNELVREDPRQTSFWPANESPPPSVTTIEGMK